MYGAYFISVWWLSHVYLYSWVRSMTMELQFLKLEFQKNSILLNIFQVVVKFRKLWQREWKVKRHFKSLKKCHWRDSFEDRKKNKISNKNSNASSYHIFLSPNPHIFYPRNPLSLVFCHYWMKSSLNSQYFVTLLNEELFKFKLYIGGKSLHLLQLVLNGWDLKLTKIILNFNY